MEQTVVEESAVNPETQEAPMPVEGDVLPKPPDLGVIIQSALTLTLNLWLLSSMARAQNKSISSLLGIASNPQELMAGIQAATTQLGQQVGAAVSYVVEKRKRKV